MLAVLTEVSSELSHCFLVAGGAGLRDEPAPGRGARGAPEPWWGCRPPALLAPALAPAHLTHGGGAAQCQHHVGVHCPSVFTFGDDAREPKQTAPTTLLGTTAPWPEVAGSKPCQKTTEA